MCRRFRGSRRFDLFEPLPPSNARERLRPRPRVPPGRTRPGAPARTFARLAASHVGARLVSRGAAGPKDKRDRRRARRPSSPLLKARREPRLDHLRRARAETREDDRVVAPGARHRPTQHGNVHRRVRCVAGCVTRLARPALRSLANRSRRSMASRVPRKRAAAIPPSALLTRSTREPLASSRIAQTPSSARVSRTTPSGRRPARRRRYAATRSRPRRFPRHQRRRRRKQQRRARFAPSHTSFFATIFVARSSFRDDARTRRRRTGHAFTFLSD